jgi:epoxyqueuosine reductase
LRHRAADHAELRFYREWLDRGYAERWPTCTGRRNALPTIHNVVPSARTVIVTATVYNTDRPYSTECPDPGCAQIARYAWGDDYHDVIGARLDSLLAWMREQSPDRFDARAYVDTGPVQERVYAQHAGIGWIGKNSCVINPELGSWVFLAAIICSLPLEVDAPSLDQCGTCTLCLEACPTQALVAPGVLDSTRCISYLTIELRGDVPDDHRAGVGSHVYGCDICQDVCPWNAAVPHSDEPAWQPRTAWDRVDLLTLSRRSDEELRAALRRSPMKRTKVEGLRRNITMALQNARTAGPGGG